jgi:hypothetical protein
MRNVRNVAAVLVLLVAPLSEATAQTSAGPKWILGAGPGAVIRTGQQGSAGLNLAAARVIQPARALYLEPGLTWHWYAKGRYRGDLCPPTGCPPPLRNSISIFGPEVRAAYRKTASNPLFPVAGIGLYRVSSQDTSGVRFGANFGLGASLRRSGQGPSLDLRYFHIFGDRRFKSVIPFSLRWSF